MPLDRVLAWASLLCLLLLVYSEPAPASEARLALDLNPGPGDGLPLAFCGGSVDGIVPTCDVSLIAPGDGFVWMSGDDGTTGIELWRLDADLASATLLTDFVSPDDTVDPGVVDGYRFGDLLYFFANRLDLGVGLWRSDGTAAGTYAIFDATTPSRSPSASIPVELGGLIYFHASPPDGVRRIWVSDGTPAGTQSFLDRVSGPAGTASVLGVVGETLFFASANGGGELWRTDGSISGTRRVASLAGDGYLGEAGGSLLFWRRRSFPRASWLTRSDGIASTVEVVRELGGDAFTAAGAVSVARGLLFFWVITSTSPVTDLWRTDGTADGTWSLGGIELGEPALAYADDVYFSRRTTAGTELWRTNGSPAGTRLLVDLAPGSASSHPADLVIWNGLLTFTAEDPLHGREIWTSDGTPAGTRLVADLAQGPGSLAPSRLTPDGDRLLFSADDGVHGRELWVLEGTPPATIPTLSWPGLAALVAGLTAAAAMAAAKGRAAR